MIRLLNPSDLPQLLTIEHLSHIAPWSNDIFQQCMNMGYVGWVEEKSERIVGFIILSMMLNECHILNLAVHPDHQRQGIGEALLVHALKAAKAKGAGITYLEVRRSNLKAIQLYKKIGFTEVSIRKNYYQTKTSQEDAIIYAIDLGVMEI